MRYRLACEPHGLSRRARLLLVVLASALALVWQPGALVADDSQSETPVLASAGLSLSPALRVVPLGSTAHLDLYYTADPVYGLWGADVRMSFDTTKISVIDASPGGTVQISNGPLVYDREPFVQYFRNFASNTAGDIQYIFYFMNNPGDPNFPSPITTNGVLASFSVNTLAVGVTCVHIYASTLSDRNGTRITNSTADSCIGVSDPTPVTLSSFTVGSRSNSLLVQWQTSSEVDLAGFNLYRGTDGEDMSKGIATKLNASLIPSEAVMPAQGATYSYSDTSAAPDITYYYWLEDVAGAGGATMHGPVSGGLIAVQLYCPLVVGP